MLEIKEDGKFFTRLLTKESSKGNPYDQSFRVYYGAVPLGVPFLWEAKPGTPKHLNHPISSYDHDHHDDHDHDHDLSIPPLTPPPSYSLGTCDPRAKKLIKSPLSNKKSKIFNGLGLFPKMIMHHRRQISMSSTSSSSGTESVPDKTRIQTQTRTQTQTHIEMSLLDDHEEEHLEEEEEEEENRRGSNTTLCFGLVGSRKIS